MSPQIGYGDLALFSAYLSSHCQGVNSKSFFHNHDVGLFGCNKDVPLYFGHTVLQKFHLRLILAIHIAGIYTYGVANIAIGGLKRGCAMRWSKRSEVRLNPFARHERLGQRDVPFPRQKPVSAIVFQYTRADSDAVLLGRTPDATLCRFDSAQVHRHCHHHILWGM